MSHAKMKIHFNVSYLEPTCQADVGWILEKSPTLSMAYRCRSVNTQLVLNTGSFSIRLERKGKEFMLSPVGHQCQASRSTNTEQSVHNETTDILHERCGGIHSVGHHSDTYKNEEVKPTRDTSIYIGTIPQMNGLYSSRVLHWHSLVLGGTSVSVTIVNPTCYSCCYSTHYMSVWCFCIQTRGAQILCNTIGVEVSLSIAMQKQIVF